MPGRKWSICAIGRPLTRPSASPHRARSARQDAGQRVRHHHRLGRGRDVHQRAVEVEQEGGAGWSRQAGGGRRAHDGRTGQLIAWFPPERVRPLIVAAARKRGAAREKRAAERRRDRLRPAAPAGPEAPRPPRATLRVPPAAAGSRSPGRPRRRRRHRPEALPVVAGATWRRPAAAPAAARAVPRAPPGRPGRSPTARRRPGLSNTPTDGLPEKVQPLNGATSAAR